MRAALLVFGLMMTASSLPASAAGAEVRRSSTPQPTRQEEPVGAWAAATPANRDCSRTRRKFWQGEDGWIVRTVVTCR